MNKKLLSLLLAMVMVLGLLAVPANAAEAPARLEQNAVRVGDAETQEKAHSITFEQNKGGTITCDTTQANTWEHVYFTITADPGYYVDVVLIEYEYWMYHARLEFQGFDQYHLEMPDGNVKITVTFTKLSGPEHEINVIADEHCTWSLDRTSARHHETLYLNVTQDKYYSADVYAVTADGLQEVEEYRRGSFPNWEYEYHMPDGAIDIYITTGKVGPYSITASAFNDGGTVSLSTNSAFYGDIVQLTILPKPGYRPLYIVPNGQGAAETVISYAGGNVWNILMPNNPVNLLVSFEESDNPFMDVPGDAFYYDSVMWALENGITNGTDLSHFAPNDVCNRAQVVTFLWRAAGSPEPTVTGHSFEDVAPGSFYEKAVLWAVEKGITTGTDETHFSPNAACNRATVVTFLYRAAGSPAPESSENPFTDVDSGSWYGNAVLWAVENGITNGLTATEFGPTADCNRAQVVTFLYRAYTE